MSNIHIANSLTAGDADFGIMLNPQSSRELLVKSFADLRMGIVVSRQHALAALESIRFSHCEPWPFYAYFLIVATFRCLPLAY